MAHKFIEQYEHALASNSLTLDIVREYVEGVGAVLDGNVYNDLSFLARNTTVNEVLSSKERGRKLTSIAVGGDLLLINWVVEQALDHAANAAIRASRSGAEETKSRAVTLLKFADSELEKLFQGTKGNLSEQWEVVNRPLPEIRYPLDN